VVGDNVRSVFDREIVSAGRLDLLARADEYDLDPVLAPWTSSAIFIERFCHAPRAHQLHLA
jgi:hypothetical protein